MKRAIACLAVTTVLAGCRAPMPSCNIFAPYGSSRVPAPSTGSHFPTNQYYPNSPQPATTPSGGLGQGAGPSYGRVADLTPAGLITPDTRPAAAAGPSQRQDAPARDPVRSRIPNLRGMPVNDATSVSEPRLLSPPTELMEITRFPEPPRGPQQAPYGVATSGERQSGAGVLADPRWRSKYSLTGAGG